jgi:hypothetical protein
MAFTLQITASAYKGGPEITEEIPNFPMDGKEALEMGYVSLDEMYDGWLANLTIAKQNKMRTSYKAPLSATRTKSGSAKNQAQVARMKAASEAAAKTAETDQADVA